MTMYFCLFGAAVLAALPAATAHLRGRGTLGPMAAGLGLWLTARRTGGSGLGRPLAVSAVGLFFQVAAHAAIILDPASLGTGAGLGPVGPVYNVFANTTSRPSSNFDLTYQTALGAVQITLRADASLRGPNAAVDGDVSGTSLSNYQPFAAAVVTYNFVVTANSGLVLRVTSVPVQIFADTLATAMGSAAAGAVIGTAVGSLADYMCTGGLLTYVSPCPSSSPTNSIAGRVPPDVTQTMTVEAWGIARGDSSFLAAADPMISIADQLIPGTNINYRDAFTVDVSPGVIQDAGGASAPEPTNLALCAAALIVPVLCRGAGNCRHAHREDRAVRLLAARQAGARQAGCEARRRMSSCPTPTNVFPRSRTQVRR